MVLKGEERIVGLTSDFVVKPETTFSDSLEGTQFRVGYAEPEITKYDWLSHLPH